MTMSPEQATERRRPAVRRASEHGSVMLGVVAIIVFVGALGVTLLTLVSGGTRANLVTCSGNQAFYMAESGARYAIAQILAEGRSAAERMNGSRFTLAGNKGFELAIEIENESDRVRYFIDSEGFDGVDGAAQRQMLNGYMVELLKSDGLGGAFSYAMQIYGTDGLDMKNSSYIDSFDSSSPDTMWTSPGAYTDGDVRVSASTNVANLGNDTAIYGTLYVGPDADLDNPTSVLNLPENVIGGSGIVPDALMTPPEISQPAELAEVPPPSSLDPVRSLPNKGSVTLDGGDYSDDSFSTGKVSVSFSGSTYLVVDSDFDVTNQGALDVSGNFGLSVGDDATVSGQSGNSGHGSDGGGLQVSGDADMTVGDDLSIGGAFTVNGDLDLDVGGDMAINDTLTVHGDADIDIRGGLSFGNTALLHIDGNVILRVVAGFDMKNGGSITLGPDATLTIYVSEGDITLKNGASINEGGIPTKVAIVASPTVESVTLHTRSTLYGALFAPNADLDMMHESQVFGAVAVEDATLKSSAAIHYDTAFRSLPGGGVDVSTLDKLRRHWVVVGSD